ncbi:unnamed protein product [Rotaria socialis]|uniref:Amidase domain-containing protein n=1 Tax=Rotaria socialis TaxID=392032 RepID=A0A819UXT0_9BILA|nr:unnamed protein product [Rotaria socialis]CAF3310194.1 unnamed protein product [Rotaria socialis]CAF3340339.1 unnamed protein product [Rotaria socialis]CAF3396234.1 unnamed protein product [Rotaria socialis]CAF3422763.1 unnamed protein product [Rotaria socialis]
MAKALQIISFILWLIRCFFSIWIHLGFRLIYGNQKFRLPAITNQILLLPATVIAKRIRQRQITAYEVVRLYIERTRAIQPYLNVYIDERFSEALAEAKEIDRILDAVSKGQRSLPHEWTEEHAPFLGVPFAIKESMEFQGFHNSTGIVARKDFISTRTATPVAHMLKAGAILLCNTNVSEGCMWFESRNALYGTTNNPYDLTRIVGGSSGGAGCIVSAVGVPIAIGADIGGSIRLPSFMNGIFGHKTTPDIVPNDGQYPPHKDFHQKYLLSTGPMCRYACDLQPMLKILAGSKNIEKLLHIDVPVDLSKLRYFYIDEIDAYFVNKVERDQQLAHRRVVEHFENKYKVHVTRLRLNRLRYAVSLWSAMMVDGQMSTRDFSLTLCNRTSYLNGYHELLRKFLFRSTHTLPAIGLAILEAVPNKYNEHFHKLAHKFYDEIQILLGNNGVLFFPTFPQSAPVHGWPVLMNTFDYIYCGIINALGLPSTQCPLGLDSKQLPLGIQCVAARGHDNLTLAVAQEIEQAMGGWVPPSVISLV